MKRKCTKAALEWCKLGVIGSSAETSRMCDESRRFTLKIICFGLLIQKCIIIMNVIMTKGDRRKDY